MLSFGSNSREIASGTKQCAIGWMSWTCIQGNIDFMVWRFLFGSNANDICTGSYSDICRGSYSNSQYINKSLFVYRRVPSEEKDSSLSSDTWIRLRRLLLFLVVPSMRNYSIVRMQSLFHTSFLVVIVVASIVQLSCRMTMIIDTSRRLIISSTNPLKLKIIKGLASCGRILGRYLAATAVKGLCYMCESNEKVRAKTEPSW